MNGSRRAFLAATETAVAAGVGGHPVAATNPDPRSTGEVAVSGSTPTLAQVTTAFERERASENGVVASSSVEHFPIPEYLDD